MSALVSAAVLSAFFIIAYSYMSTTTSIIRSAPKTVSLTVRKRGSNKQTEQASLLDLLRTRCPSIFSDFKPAWWLLNGHLQTLYCVLGDFSRIDHVTYRRKYLRLPDGGTLGLDFTPTDSLGLSDDTPIIVVTHGLTGGSYEAYVRAPLSKACAPVADGGLGYRAVVVNFRGCAGVPTTSTQLYSAGHTDDLRQALIYISHIYPKAPLLGIGFSLGANVITRYVAEEGIKSRLRSCCALGCPWDLAQNNISIKSTFMGRRIYSRGMGTNLSNLVKKNYKALTVDPDHPVAKAAEAVLDLKNPTLDVFDEYFTCKAGGSSPPFPFATANDYYQWASSHDVVNNIRVPYLAINADDDPIVQRVPLDDIQNDYIVMGLTRGGGHLGWFQSKSALSLERWTTKPVLEWFKLMGEDVLHEPTPASTIIIDQEGFLREEERPHLGCRELEDEVLVDWTTNEAGMLQGL
ncbi:hypothetical protein M378DRAFT_156964 [Amanita muscaria Koide BX008]|uniref:AB hydrolase-1 domain-containing protein n=1 Tax=Amanita muscaria (strain Koide BX008) TaxID=946122 RepID=A0A0C2T1P5_AMAMK|nr:hypothetical protein M378DRAFT_156964 [Amanita muscaria Koide BX008]